MPRSKNTLMETAERERAKRRLAAQHAVTHILGESHTLEDAAPKILQAICETAGWEMGALWSVDRQADVLRCVQAWHVPGLHIHEFVAQTRQTAFPRGIGLPGRVWAATRPTWIPDVTRDPNFPRAPVASRSGLHGAFAFPIIIRDEVVGVIEFFSREVREPDDELLTMFTITGSQIGQFMERKRAEEGLDENEERIRRILESALDAVVSMDSEGLIIDWNPQAETTFGWKRNEIVGQPLVLTIIPAQYREAHKKGLARFLESGVGPILNQRIEITALHRDGHEFPVELTVSPLVLRGSVVFSAFIRDITEQKRALEAIRTNEELYRTIGEATHDFLWACAPNGRSEFVNSRWMEYTGMTLERANSVPLEATHHPDDLPKLRKIWRSATKKGQSFSAELRYRRYDGVFRWFFVRAVPIKDEAGRVIRWIGTSTDIHDRKTAIEEIERLNRELELRVKERSSQLERANDELKREVEERKQTEIVLRHSEERFRLLVASVRDYAIYMVDPAGNIASWNIGAERIKGYTSEEIVGKHFSVFYPPEDVKSGRPEWELRNAAAEGRLEDEGWRVRKDGSRFWANVIISVVRDEKGKLRGFSKVTRDLTERKRIEEALASQASLLDLAHDAIIVRDRDSKITFWNAGAEALYGWKEEEAMGAVTHTLLQTEFPLPPKEIEQALMHEGQWEGELRHKTRSGKHIIVASRQALQRDADGKPKAILEINRDITARRNAEDTLRQLTVQLTATNKELEAFSYSVSHDLRAPLRAMDGFSQAILEDYGDALDAQGHDYLMRVRAASQRMAQLIDDLLELSRVTRAEIVMEEVDLSDLARTITSELHKRAPDRCVEFAITDGIKARADAGLIHVVLDNLLDNAWKFSSKKECSQIEFGEMHNGERPVNFVRDNGAGFDMEYADKLFGAFQRLHSTAEFDGTGVGLATVQRVINRHGGRVWAESAVGKGATFYFTV